MKMNGLRRLLLAVGLLASATAHATALPPDEPLKVSRLELRTSERHYSYTDAQSTERASRIPVQSSKGNNVYEPHLGVRNTTSKTIVKVKWEVVLYRDVSRSKVLRTYSYRTKREIRPGQDVVLQGADLAYPTIDHVYPYEGRIVGVTYADGTTWSRS